MSRFEKIFEIWPSSNAGDPRYRYYSGNASDNIEVRVNGNFGSLRMTTLGQSIFEPLAFVREASFLRSDGGVPVQYEGWVYHAANMAGPTSLFVHAGNWPLSKSMPPIARVILSTNDTDDAFAESELEFESERTDF